MASLPDSSSAMASDVPSLPMDQTEPRNASFVCPNCGECTIEQYFLKNGCSKQVSTKKKALFPYLDVSGLDEADRTDLEDRLELETRNIIFRFARFKADVESSLEDLLISVEKMKRFILSLRPFPNNIAVKMLDEEDRKKIEDAKTLSEVFITLCNYTSFFNYQIIEHIIDQFGSAMDRKRMEDYLESFHNFCKRNVFQIPQYAFTSISRKTAKVLALKCTLDDSTLEGVKRVIGDIARALGLRPSALQLCCIEEGCVELHFMISATIADCIFPVSPSQYSALSEIGIRVLTYENVDHQTNKIPQPLDAIQGTSVSPSSLLPSNSLLYENSTEDLDSEVKVQLETEFGQFKVEMEGKIQELIVEVGKRVKTVELQRDEALSKVENLQKELELEKRDKHLCDREHQQELARKKEEAGPGDNGVGGINLSSIPQRPIPVDDDSNNPPTFVISEKRPTNSYLREKKEEIEEKYEELMEQHQLQSQENEHLKKIVGEKEEQLKKVLLEREQQFQQMHDKKLAEKNEEARVRDRQLQKIAKQFADKGQELHEKDQQLQKAEAMAQEKQQEIEELRAQVVQLTKEKKNLESVVANLQQEIGVLNQEMFVFKLENEELKQELNKCLRHADLRNALDEQNKQTKDEMRKMFAQLTTNAPANLPVALVASTVSKLEGDYKRISPKSTSPVGTPSPNRSKSPSPSPDNQVS